MLALMGFSESRDMHSLAQWDSLKSHIYHNPGGQCGTLGNGKAANILITREPINQVDYKKITTKRMLLHCKTYYHSGYLED